MAASSWFSFSIVQPTKPKPLSTHTSSFSSGFPVHKASGQQHEQDLSMSVSVSRELSSVINPSHAHANTLFFRSAYNVQVVVDENESDERLLNRFRKEVMKAGVIQECKRRRFFENKQEEKKRKTREAAKRRSRSRRGPFRSQVQNKQDVEATKKEEDDDNWDLPEVDAPYL